MDFFDREAHARRQTRRLVWLLGLAVLAVVALIYLVLASVIHAFQHPLIAEARWNPMAFLIPACFLFGKALFHPLHFLELIWNPHHAAWITLGTLVSIAAVCFYKTRSLSQGGPAVAGLLGGRCVAAKTSDADGKKLRDVAEEMAIASGMPVASLKNDTGRGCGRRGRCLTEK